MDAHYTLARLAALEDTLNREMHQIEEGLERNAPTELRGAVRAGRVAGLARGLELVSSLRHELARQEAREARR